jgi:hypothetical protein
VRADIDGNFFAQLIRDLQAILVNERLEVQEAVYKSTNGFSRLCEGLD